MAKLQPVPGKIILKPIQEETTTASGIVLPDTVDKERPEKAEVIAVGEAETMESGNKKEMPVSVGDKVLFTKYGPSEVKIDGEELLIASAGDILAIIK